MRHNALRDCEAMLMREVAKDVQTEPGMLPVGENVQLKPGTNRKAQARLDISARGIWSPCEKTFFDVRVTHPNTKKNRNRSLEQIYASQEEEKKNLYNDRVLQVEKASFIPLVFTTTGGMGPECEKANKKIAEKIATKTKETYSHVMNHVRTRLRFALLRSVLVGIRGYRGGYQRRTLAAIQDIDFNLIPEESCYEVDG